ncbi:iron chelate uptake ABC transporter family permease subunit [Erysipelothrix sp. HDW6C]|uniref:iron chelate uptake ABC transporter family permease subunit n=1 Tax=Erysipelothrix sp. HDW6C TaxID=2714930 RepID=UPI00140E80D2|nr:iron chelate uptake ABC transporter family permease subunit [Erysipelothrix sp. HDW6C]QIK70477.1 iron chelate uptake ABC transporter family permease subunit [Erysipelothrix sp. HDW6C]
MKRKYILPIICIGLSLIYLLIGVNANNIVYLMYRRLTRLIAVAFVSLLINIATVYFQNMTNNRILTPSLLGFDRLFMLIQVIIVFFVKQYVSSMTLFVIVVTVMTLISVLIYTVVLRVIRTDLFTLLLVGTVMGTLFGSITSTLQMMMDPNEFSIIQNQSFASFNAINVDVLWVGMVLSLVGFWAVWKLHKQVDVVALGETHARNLGIDVRKFQYYALIMIAVFISITTALVGPISFLGLLTTNIARESIKGFRTREIVKYGTYLSIALLVAGQLIFERMLHFNTSISVVLNILGGIYFIRLMLKERFS